MLPDDPGANQQQASQCGLWVFFGQMLLYYVVFTLREIFGERDSISILIWSDVRSRLLAKLGTLIMMHSWGFESLPSIAISPETNKKDKSVTNEQQNSI